MPTISISQSKVEKQKGVVILTLKEYHKLVRRTAPVYYLEGKEAKALDALVAKGLREHREGKTKAIKSLADLG